MVSKSAGRLSTYQKATMSLFFAFVSQNGRMRRQWDFLSFAFCSALRFANEGSKLLVILRTAVVFMSSL